MLPPRRPSPTKRFTPFYLSTTLHSDAPLACLDGTSDTSRPMDARNFSGDYGTGFGTLLPLPLCRPLARFSNSSCTTGRTAPTQCLFATQEAIDIFNSCVLPGLPSDSTRAWATEQPATKPCAPLRCTHSTVPWSLNALAPALYD